MNEEYNYYPIVPDTTSNSGVLPSDLDKIKPNTEAVAPTDSNIVPSGNGTVMNTGQLQSPNFVVGSSGWIIRADGTAEFGYLVIRNGSRIANWYVNTNTIASAATDAASGILLDSANQLIRVGASTGNFITIDGVNLRIRSSNYVAGVAGFTIEPTLIEAENLVARGTMRGVTFKYDVVSAVGGQLMVTNSDALASDMTALDSATLTVRGDSTFAVNDILVIRAVTASGIQEEWLRVTNVASAPTYTVTRDLAASFGANVNPVWKAGTCVAKQGISDGAAAFSGGWLRLFGEGTNSPYYSVFSRTGVAYNSFAERVRLGNLNGTAAFVADTYGIFIGNYSTGKYLTYDDVSGNLVVNGYVQSNKGTFGGDGSDGALSVVAGTTTLSFGSAQTLIKNYTTISVSAGATLAFSTPNANGSIAQIKTNGAMTIAGTVDLTAMGATGGAGAGGGGNGSLGNDGYGNIKDSTTGNFGIGSGTTGAGGASTSAIRLNPAVLAKILSITPGSGGGGGGGGNGGGGGQGGLGGGAIIFECGTTWNFTGTINVTGGVGTQGTDNNGNSGGGGGGGGSAGMIVALYNTLTSDAGTYTVTGGAGGKGGNSNSNGGSQGGGGGAGGAHNSASGAGGARGAASTNGSAGSAGGGASGGAGGNGGTRTGTDGGGGGGGGGGTGLAYSAVNNYYA